MVFRGRILSVEERNQLQQMVISGESWEVMRIRGNFTYNQIRAMKVSLGLMPAIKKKRDRPDFETVQNNQPADD